MNHTILNGDVLECLRSLPDCSVQCVVTSPPYWGLRDYGVPGQIGLEPTLEAHIEKLVEVFREVWRVLRDDGTVWLNYGDRYAGSATGADRPPEPGHTHEDNGRVKTGQENKHRRPDAGLKQKDLVGMPWRIAFALQADGWYLRSDIIWSKPNPMPESVTDRPTRAHEYIFLLTKLPRYFYDADAVREEQTGNAHSRGKGLTPKSAPEGSNIRAKESWHLSTRDVEVPGGRNRRTVWEISPQPMPDAHFAAFPEALVEPCIKAGTSERGCCPECGAPWRRSTTSKRLRRDELDPSDPRYRPNRYKGAYSDINGRGDAGYTERTTVGWAPSCTCSAGDPIPCVVLDPFGGSGTVAKVARDLGRSSVMIELNPDYVNIMKKRLRIREQLNTGVCEYFVRKLPLAGR